MYVINVNPQQEPQGKIGFAAGGHGLIHNPVVGACHFVVDTRKELETAGLAIKIAELRETIGESIEFDAALRKGPVFGGLLDFMEYLATGTVSATGRS